MSTENLGPAMLCCPPCPAAVYGKGIDWIEKIVKKIAEKKLRKHRVRVEPRRV